MWVKCPQCGKKILKDEVHSRLPNLGGQGSSYFPFCSRKCKLVDLEGWLENRYKITISLNAERSEDDD